MHGARTDILRQPDLRRTARTTGRMQPTAGQSITGCTTVTGRRLAVPTRAAVAAVVPPRTRTPCRR